MKKSASKWWVIVVLLLLITLPVVYYTVISVGGDTSSDRANLRSIARDTVSGTKDRDIGLLSPKEKAKINNSNYRAFVDALVAAETSDYHPVIYARNVFNVVVKDNVVLVNDVEVDMEEVGLLYKSFVTNPQNSEELPVMGEVSLPLIGKITVASRYFCTVVHYPTTADSLYSKVAEEVYISINELRDSLALNRFGSSFDNCTEQEREACRLAYPCEVLEHGMNVDGENPFWVTDVLPLSSSTQESVCDSDFFVDDVSQPQSGTLISDYVDVADTEYIYVEEEAEGEDETIFQVVEQQAEFPGGMQALYKYLGDNIQYPRVSRENNSQGRVFIRFVVNSDGSIQDAEVIKSSGDVYLDKEAVRVVAGMPKWKPGMHSGKPVRVYYTVPVMFRLQ